MEESGLKRINKYLSEIGYCSRRAADKLIAERLGEKPILSGNTPLWYYVLAEAETLGGYHLGPVGSTIVGETILDLILGDPDSYLTADPRWTPWIGGGGADFQLYDLLSLGWNHQAP